MLIVSKHKSLDKHTYYMARTVLGISLLLKTILQLILILQMRTIALREANSWFVVPQMKDGTNTNTGTEVLLAVKCRILFPSLPHPKNPHCGRDQEEGPSYCTALRKQASLILPFSTNLKDTESFNKLQLFLDMVNQNNIRIRVLS